MRLSLKPHPDTPCEAVHRIDVELHRPSPQALRLRYQLRGSLSGLIIPAPAAPVRRDELWQHTCFELFIRPGDSEAYFEFNFSPSREWAAYELSGYRSGMTQLDLPDPPRMETNLGGEQIQVLVDLETGAPADRPWRTGLSAVIEDQAGARSFWALAHPPGEPDFHSPDCFALELGPPAAP